MGWMRAIAMTWTLFLAVFVANAQAWTFDDPQPAPKYFSGTSSRAWGGVLLLPKPDEFEGFYSMAWAEMRIGSYMQTELASRWDLPAGAVDPVAGNWFAGVFDSAKFSPGSSVWVEIRAMDTAGQYYYAARALPCKNKATNYARADMTGYDPDNFLTWGTYSNQWISGNIGWRTADIVESELQGSNYDVLTNTNMGWTAAQYLSDLTGSNVSVISTHGTPDHLWSDSDDYNFFWPYSYSPPPHEREYIVGTGTQSPPSYPILPMRKAQVGYSAPLPPYNASGNPPINISLHFSCGTGSNEEFMQGYLWPYQWAFPNTPLYENMAHMGFEISVQLNALRGLSQAVMDTLSEGHTMGRAALAAYLYYTSIYDIPQSSAEEMLTVGGDDKARLRSVYTGDNTVQPLSTWFRPLF